MSKKPTYEALKQRIRELELVECQYKWMLAEQQQKEKRYQNLFDNMLHEVHVWELVFDDVGDIKTWNLVDANTAALKSWKKNLSQIVGKTTDEIFPKSNASELFMPVVKKIFEEGKPHIWESYFPDTNQFLHMISVPFGGYFISTGLDITERKQAEEKLLKSEEKYRYLINSLQEGIWQIDKEAITTYVNSPMAEMLGYTQDDMKGKHLFEFMNKSCEKNAAFKLKRRQEGMKEQHEFEFMHKNGTKVYTLLETIPLSNKDGQYEGALASVMNISERKKTEETLRKQNYFLEKAQKLGRIGTWEIDFLHNKIAWTDENFEIFGVPKENVVDYETFLDKVHPDDRDYVRREWQAAVEGKLYDLEHRILLDGEVKWVREKADIVFDDYGKAINAIGITQDISERKRLENELLKSQKMKSIGTLAGGIAHEFNNILSIIIGNNELIMEDLPKRCLSRDCCEEIHLAGMRARDVVKHLLTFSRQNDSTKNSIDIASVTTEALKLIRAMTPSNIEISDRISPDCLPIFGDSTQIHQILINLCNNAVDALPISGGKINIELCNSSIEKSEVPSTGQKPSNKYVRLLVRDNGSGIDTEILDRVFEPYFTTKDVGKGCGIGLAVVHGIVENHGGSIACESCKGEGTTFTILIPAHEGRVAEELDKKDILSGNGEKILYVDDEPSIAKLGRRYLESLGYDVYSTTDPEEALAMVKAEPDRFNLIISDMAMPNMPGDQLITEILTINPEMPTMICSGYSSRMTETKATEMGIKAFVMKPLNKAELTKKVREVLDGSNQIVK